MSPLSLDRVCDVIDCDSRSVATSSSALPGVGCRVDGDVSTNLETEASLHAIATPIEGFVLLTADGDRQAFLGQESIVVEPDETFTSVEKNSWIPSSLSESIGTFEIEVEATADRCAIEARPPTR